MITEELGHFAVGVDKLAAVFGEAYPQLDIRLNWDWEKTTGNIAPFLGHFLGTFSSPDGRGLLTYSHGAANNNKFVLEGGYFNFDRVLPILGMYGITEVRDRFILIGLVQNKKTVGEFINDFKTHDTENDWTYGFSDDDLREISEDLMELGKYMTGHLTEHGFTIYDTSANRERVFDQILEDIKRTVDNGT